MTKALRITSIAVAAAAVMLVAMPVVFSSGMDEQTRSLLDSPGVLESLNKAAKVTKTGTVSPLVQQAKKFAAYLKPPPPPPPSPPRSSRAPARPEGPVSVKFNLLGTSYYPQRPELSLALIDEPGKGLRWIRQSSKIGYLVVEEVKDGKVVIRDGTRTYEIEPKRTPRRSLVRGETTYDIDAPSQLQSSAMLASPPFVGVTRQPQRPSHRTTSGGSESTLAASQPQQDIQGADEFNPAEAAVIEEFFKMTEDINDPNEWVKKADELMERLAAASQITDQEAEQLDELGKQLQDANEKADSGKEGPAD
jgi:hypothetical protein